MASQDNVFALNTNPNAGSKLSSLTNPRIAGNIKYLTKSSTTPLNPAQLAAITDGSEITGIAFPIGNAATHDIALPVGTPWYEADAGERTGSTNNGFNQIGDPDEKNYSLTTGDLQYPQGHALEGNERHGSAQKFINALLDSAYVAYNSGVQQGSGLSSMTVSRGDLSLGSTQVTGISGAINKYSRSYTVTFSYTQTGFIANINGALHTEALPDISDDLKDDDTDPKPF